ncbi:MAG: hypothetical protein UH850_06660 [Paludibacteraceae bacterium]|nr:hypothetical protein [Paludibacteraceae bacterium]MEE1083402.1 hypothetical protein [Paludibacteraceae bacterium]
MAQDEIGYDDKEAVEFILANLDEEYADTTAEEVEYILDILYDYYEEQGFFDEDSDDEVDIDEDEILQYVVDQVEKDKKAGEKLAQKFDEDRIAEVLEGEYGYCDKTGVFTDNEDEE